MKKTGPKKLFLLFRNISKCIYCVDPVVSHHLFSPRQTGLRSAHHQQARGRLHGVSPAYPCAGTEQRRDVPTPWQTAADPGFRADVSRRTFPCGGRCSPPASTGCSAPLSPAWFPGGTLHTALDLGSAGRLSCCAPDTLVEDEMKEGGQCCGPPPRCARRISALTRPPRAPAATDPGRA